MRSITITSIIILFSIPTFLNVTIVDALGRDHRDGGDCQHDRDCAYNGRCRRRRRIIVGTTATRGIGTCVCTPPWEGPHCERLRTLPVPLDGGFGSPHANSSSWSTWGGSVVFDESGDRKWHMFASQMLNGCGIDYWEPNSRVVHAVSDHDSPEGPYTYESVVADAWAHEPNAVRSPEGDWVVYFSMRDPAGWEENCTTAATTTTTITTTVDSNNDNNELSSVRTSTLQRQLHRRHHHTNLRFRYHDSDEDDDDKSNFIKNPPPRNTYMTHSKSPYGPWSEPKLILQANYSKWDGRPVLIDTNLAVVILESGAVVGIWRKCINIEGTKCEKDCCTFPRLLRASNWSDPATYWVDSDRSIFDDDDIEPFGAEDPMLWTEEKDDDAGGEGVVIHAILHDEQGSERCTSIGRHAFSDDGGETWVYARENAYNGTVVWKDRHRDGVAVGTGTARIGHLFRRERPHMIMSPSVDTNNTTTNNNKHKIVAISNGIQESRNTDRSWTMIQPLYTTDEQI